MANSAYELQAICELKRWGGGGEGISREAEGGEHYVEQQTINGNCLGRRGGAKA